MFGFLENEKVGKAVDLELIRKQNDFSPKFIMGFERLGVGGIKCLLEVIWGI